MLLRGGGLFTRERIYLCEEESKQEAIMKGEIKYKEGKTQSSGLRKNIKRKWCLLQGRKHVALTGICLLVYLTICLAVESGKNAFPLLVQINVIKMSLLCEKFGHNLHNLIEHNQFKIIVHPSNPLRFFSWPQKKISFCNVLVVLFFSITINVD